MIVVPTEFADVQREYPIFFRKDARPVSFHLCAAGFSKDENLFLDEGTWKAAYVPGSSRAAILIGFQERREGGECSGTR